MRVPGVIYATEILDSRHGRKVYEQVTNVATLPGIVKASYAMPDAHWGYGFPIGGVAAFDPDRGGVVSAGGVGFDISCGVRTLHTGLHGRGSSAGQGTAGRRRLFQRIPAGVGSTGQLHSGSARDGRHACAAARGGPWNGAMALQEDLERIEEHGCMAGAQTGVRFGSCQEAPAG